MTYYSSQRVLVRLRKYKRAQDYGKFPPEDGNFSPKLGNLPPEGIFEGFSVYFYFAGNFKILWEISEFCGKFEFKHLASLL